MHVLLVHASIFLENVRRVLPNGRNQRNAQISPILFRALRRLFPKDWAMYRPTWGSNRSLIDEGCEKNTSGRTYFGSTSQIISRSRQREGLQRSKSYQPSSFPSKRSKKHDLQSHDNCQNVFRRLSETVPWFLSSRYFPRDCRSLCTFQDSNHRLVSFPTTDLECLNLPSPALVANYEVLIMLPCLATTLRQAVACTIGRLFCALWLLNYYEEGRGGSVIDANHGATEVRLHATIFVLFCFVFVLSLSNVSTTYQWWAWKKEMHTKNGSW